MICSYPAELHVESIIVVGMIMSLIKSSIQYLEVEIGCAWSELSFQDNQ